MAPQVSKSARPGPPAYGSGNHVSGFGYDGGAGYNGGMGNVTNDGANTYTYDAGGRPITAAGVQTTFDAFERALERNNGGTYTQVVYSPSGTKFAFMNGQSLVKYMDPMVAGMAAVHNGDGTGYFQHADWLGSSRLAHDGSGAVKYDRAYAPFGEIYAETATTNRNFTGQTQDTVSGLYDLLFRQQSQSQGRWLVPDPAGLAAIDLTNPQTWNRYAYVGNNPLSNVDPLGLDDSTTTCDSNGHCTNVTNVDVTASAPSWFWLAFEGWPGTGGAQTLFCMMFGSCGGSGSSGGSGGGGGQAQPPAQPKPQPKPCGTTGLHGGIGVSYGGSIDAGAMTAGLTATGSAGWGLFLDQSSTVSNGGFAGGGAAAYFGPLSIGAPAQQGYPFSTGLFAGAGPNVWITNARSVQQLKGPFTTLSVNAGGGPVRGSVQLSYGGGVWQFSLGLPIPYTGAATPSISVTKVTTKTFLTSSGCGG